MFVVKLLLNTNMHDAHALDKRFRLMNTCHNILVSYAQKQLDMLHRDKDYCKGRKLYARAKKQKDEALRKEAGAIMNAAQKRYVLNETGLQKYIAPWQGQHAKHLSSFQCQKEATRVAEGVGKVLFSGGRKLHYHKGYEQHTICGKDAKNGIRFDVRTMSMNYLGLEVKCKRIKGQYKLDALAIIENDPTLVSMYEISREAFPNGYHYYLDIYIKAGSPKEYEHGTCIGGIDPGVSTMAYVSDTKVLLAELAPRSKEYDKQIRKTLKSLDRSRRATNPEHYRADGTVIRGRGRFRKSGHYIQALWDLRTLYRKKAAYTKQSHDILANEIIRDSIYIHAEGMEYRKLAKRGKKTERSDTQSAVIKSDGTEIQVRKYKRKKRFGKTISNRSPAGFLSILKQKAKRCGGYLSEVETAEYKASQYDHITDTYTRTTLKQREKRIGGHTVQRDLYSAFLIRNTDTTHKHPDRDKCSAKFETFVSMQDACIRAMKEANISYKACFGF